MESGEALESRERGGNGRQSGKIVKSESEREGGDGRHSERGVKRNREGEGVEHKPTGWMAETCACSYYWVFTV